MEYTLEAYANMLATMTDQELEIETDLQKSLLKKTMQNIEQALKIQRETGQTPLALEQSNGDAAIASECLALVVKEQERRHIP